MENLLITRAGAGVIWALVLFIICFFAVHITRLANLGRQAQKRMQQDSPPKPTEEPEKKAPQPSGEPIYYIVEKKRRAKTSFSPPKEIKFK